MWAFPFTYTKVNRQKLNLNKFQKELNNSRNSPGGCDELAAPSPRMAY